MLSSRLLTLTRRQIPEHTVSLFTDASRYIPGGVNSPVRAFRAVGGEPVFIERASGAYVFGHDGRRYIDYVGSWGPMILGHAHPDRDARRAGARRARACRSARRRRSKPGSRARSAN